MSEDAHGWAKVPEDKRPAIEDAMLTLQSAKVGFVLLVFAREDGLGAILSNLDPRQTIGPLETALAAAKAGVEFSEIPHMTSRQ
jgi:hypothetical protein